VSNALDQLVRYLAGTPAGRVISPREVESLLAACWDEFHRDGDDGGMFGYKLLGRTEEMTWNSPELHFQIERHGGTVAGSVYAEIQYWTVDLTKLSACLAPVADRRLVGKQQLRVDVEPIAEEITARILAGDPDERLKWDGNRKVRILIGRVFPGKSAAQQTLTGRRKRLMNAIDARLRHSKWQKIELHTFQKEEG
jgi:hypothetical protein